MDLHVEARLPVASSSEPVFRVLVVDDTPAVHGDFRKILAPEDDGTQSLDALEASLFGTDTPGQRHPSRLSFQVDCAFQGEEALRLVKEAKQQGRPYCLAFMDMRMPPGMNGVDTTLKLWQADPELQIVICSAYSDQSWNDIADCLGVSESWFVLRKPFDAIEVLQVTHALSRKWILARRAQERMESLERAVRLRTRDLQIKNQELEAEVEQRKRAENDLVHLATHDALTGVPNRSLLRSRLNEALSRARRRHGIVGVLFLDLDHFKEVNDVYGHAAGDQLLRAVSERLRSSVRAFDTVARTGGDEFVLLLEELAEPEEAAIVAERVLAAFATPFSVVGQVLHVRPSIGIAVHPHDGSDAENLIKSADIAMYDAKERGRGTFAFYAADMLASSQEKLRLREQLIHALRRGELRLMYQPLVDLCTSAICGFEALVRWEHPTLGTIAPARFIPVAEKSGLIVEIGAWVLETACAQLAQWQAAGWPDLRMAVNVSAREVQAPGFFERVSRAVHRAGIQPSTLEVELTETAAMKDPARSTEVLDQLHELGVRLAIDDFGIGYSSLMRLKEIPISVLKIDRCFVQGVEFSQRDAIIVRGVVSMAHALGISVVAEGVETAEQLRALRELGPEPDPNAVCDRVQGYLISEPLPADVATRLLAPASKELREAAHG